MSPSVDRHINRARNRITHSCLATPESNPAKTKRGIQRPYIAPVDNPITSIGDNGIDDCWCVQNVFWLRRFIALFSYHTQRTAHSSRRTSISTTHMRPRQNVLVPRQTTGWISQLHASAPAWAGGTALNRCGRANTDTRERKPSRGVRRNFT